MRIAARILAPFAVAAFAASAADLYRLDVNEKNPKGKDLVLTVQETRHEERTSEARVTFKSGGSVASSMTIMRAFYEMAVARKATHFVKLKEWEGPDGDYRYLIGFAPSDHVPEDYFGVPIPPAEPRLPRFTSVETFRTVFGDPK